MGGLLEIFLQHCLEFVNAIQQQREAAKVCRGCDCYPRAMTLIDLANPTRFLSLTARLLPYLVAGTAIVLAVGLYLSATAPDDYQQGATVKIMFIHVANAWLSMFVLAVISASALRTFVWRHSLADVGVQAAAPPCGQF